MFSKVNKIQITKVEVKEACVVAGEGVVPEPEDEDQTKQVPQLTSIFSSSPLTFSACFSVKISAIGEDLS